MTKVRPVTYQKKVNDICINDVSLTVLAEQYGTPLYVVDEQTIRHNCQLFTNILTKHYPNFKIAYASKAGLNIGIANVIASEGCGADVVSGGELYTVLKSNISKDEIYFHGNNKSYADLEMAIDNHIKIVVDNKDELSLVEQISSQKSIQARLLFRLKPGIEANTHDYIKTGQSTSKFGMTMDEVFSLIKTVEQSSWGEFLGIHAHIGSQITDLRPYVDLVEILVQFISKIRDDLNVYVKELNCGGGFGVQYMEADPSFDIPEIVAAMADKIIQRCEFHQLDLPILVFEPGRSIIANAGVTLYSVGSTKFVSDQLTYLFVDGGMADNPRPMMYQAEYTFDVVNPRTPNRQVYTIAGKYCESSDILAKDVMLPIVNSNDLIVVYGTGAYNYSMASNYNRFCKPSMVLVNSGKATLIVRRETYDDLIRFDVQ